MDDVSDRLRHALVGAYPPHVHSRVESGEAGLEAAIGEGSAWLDAALADLLRQPFSAQRRGPLELFQEAMHFPTKYLAGRGVEPARRDPVAVAALPGDIYDLAPASTRDLGEEVWRLHLAWGATKAAALTRPDGAAPADAGS